MGPWPEEFRRPVEPLAGLLEEPLAERAAKEPFAEHFASTVGPLVADSA